MALEEIIRPFQSPKPLGTRRVISTSTKLPPETVHLSWGKVGTLPTPVQAAAKQPAAGVSFTAKLLPDGSREGAPMPPEDSPPDVEKEDQKLVEKDSAVDRAVEKVKVVQEGNPDNYVIIERILSIAFSNARKEQTVLTRPQPKPPNGPTTKPAKKPIVDAGGDIPVTVVGDTLYVDKRKIPDKPGYFKIGERIFVLDQPPLGPNEELVE